MRYFRSSKYPNYRFWVWKDEDTPVEVHDIDGGVEKGGKFSFGDVEMFIIEEEFGWEEIPEQEVALLI